MMVLEEGGRVPLGPEEHLFFIVLLSIRTFVTNLLWNTLYVQSVRGECFLGKFKYNLYSLLNLVKQQNDLCLGTDLTIYNCSMNYIYCGYNLPSV